MIKKSVYIETSIASYLTARPTGALVAAAWQSVTSEWWATRRHLFDLYTSDLVLDEASKGNSDAAARRLDALRDLTRLALTDEVAELASVLLEGGALPSVAADDATHIAISAVHRIDYLLTWNCRHIDNAETKPLIRRLCAARGFDCPEICTPQELMGLADDD